MSTATTMDKHEHLDMELAPEPILAPATGSLLLHVGLAGIVVTYALFAGLFHHASWGGHGGGSAMQVHLVSDALPLPSDQPPNKNVLATDNPSQAPAPPEPKTSQPEDVSDVPIPDPFAKQKTQKSYDKVDPNDPRVQFGQQGGSQIARSTQPQTATAGPVSTTEGNFGSRFAYYVSVIDRELSKNWLQQQVDPHTPKGARAFILFTVRQDGTLTDIRMDHTSGSPTLDRTCLRAAQRIDTFGPLPTEWDKPTVLVSSYCEFTGSPN